MKWLISGGCGFIGCNAASQLLAAGEQVVVLDNLGRQGSAENRAWLGGLAGATPVAESIEQLAAWVKEEIVNDVRVNGAAPRKKAVPV